MDEQAAPCPSTLLRLGQHQRQHNSRNDQRRLMSGCRFIRESFRLACYRLRCCYSRVHDAVNGNDASIFPLASTNVARPRMFSALSVELTVIEPV